MARFTFGDNSVIFRGILFDLAGTLSIKDDGKFTPIPGAAELVCTAQSLKLPRAVVTSTNQTLLQINLEAIGFASAFPTNLLVPNAEKLGGSGFTSGLELINREFKVELSPGNVLVLDDDPQYAKRALQMGFAACCLSMYDDVNFPTDPRFIRVPFTKLGECSISE